MDEVSRRKFENLAKEYLEAIDKYKELSDKHFGWKSIDQMETKFISEAVLTEIGEAEAKVIEKRNQIFRFLGFEE